MVQPDEGELAVDAVDVACEVGDVGCRKCHDVAAGAEFFAEVEEVLQEPGDAVLFQQDRVFDEPEQEFMIAGEDFMDLCEVGCPGGCDTFAGVQPAACPAEVVFCPGFSDGEDAADFGGVRVGGGDETQEPCAHFGEEEADDHFHFFLLFFFGPHGEQPVDDEGDDEDVYREEAEAVEDVGEGVAFAVVTEDEKFYCVDEG